MEVLAGFLRSGYLQDLAGIHAVEQSTVCIIAATTMENSDSEPPSELLCEAVI